jgi:hypothetical protein
METCPKTPILLELNRMILLLPIFDLVQNQEKKKNPKYKKIYMKIV